MTVQLVLVTSLEFVRSLVVCSKLKKVCEDLVQVSVHLLHFVRKRDRLFAEQTKFGTSLVHLLLLPSTLGRPKSARALLFAERRPNPGLKFLLKALCD